jgi:hypothetical protein
MGVLNLGDFELAREAALPGDRDTDPSFVGDLFISGRPLGDLGGEPSHPFTSLSSPRWGLYPSFLPRLGGLLNGLLWSRITGPILVLGDRRSVIFGSLGLGLGVRGPLPATPDLTGDIDRLELDDGLDGSGSTVSFDGSSLKLRRSSLSGVP